MKLLHQDKEFTDLTSVNPQSHPHCGAANMLPLLLLPLLFSLFLAIADPSDSRKNITVILGGGTVSAKGNDSTGVTGYHVGELSVEDIINTVPDIHELANIHFIQFDNRDSKDITLEWTWDLHDCMVKVLNDPTQEGLMLLLGTDAFEEVMASTHRKIWSTKPIVGTLAIRPATAISADGPRNIRLATITAVHMVTHHIEGQVMVSGDKILSHQAYKFSSYQVDAFKPKDGGLLGHFADDKPILYQPVIYHPPRGVSFSYVPQKLTLDLESAVVAIIYIHPEASASLAILAVELLGVKGLVIATFSNGHLPSGYEEALQGLDVPIVMTSQLEDGFVSKSDVRLGIAGGSLRPRQARVWLQQELLLGSEHADVKTKFELYA
jgi:L-asparaginase